MAKLLKFRLIILSISVFIIPIHSKESSTKVKKSLSSSEILRLKSSVEVSEIDGKLNSFFKKGSLRGSPYRDNSYEDVAKFGMTPPKFKAPSIGMEKQKPKYMDSLPLPSSPSTPSRIQMLLKTIEILADKASVNLSTLNRRSQLHVISRLSKKLPYEDAIYIQEGLKSTSFLRKIFEHLPEPERDPLLEDDVHFLKEYVKNVMKPTPVNNDNDFIHDKPSSSFIHQSIVSEANNAKLVMPTLPTYYDYIPGIPRDNVHSKLVSMESSQKEVRVPYKDVRIKLMDEAVNAANKANKNSEDELEQEAIKDDTTTSDKNDSEPQKSDQTRVLTKLIDVEPIYDFEVVNQTKSNVVVKIPAKSNDPFGLSNSEISEVLHQVHGSSKVTEDKRPAVPNAQISFFDEISTNDAKPIETKSKTLTRKIPLKMKPGKSRIPDSHNDEKLTQASAQHSSVLPTNKPHPLDFPDHPLHEDLLSEEKQFKKYLQEVLQDMMTSEESKLEDEGRPFGGLPSKSKIPHHLRPLPSLRHPIRKPSTSLFGGRPLIRNKKPFSMLPHLLSPSMRQNNNIKNNTFTKINEVTVSKIENNGNISCDFFSDEVCLVAKDYPTSSLLDLLKSHPDLVSKTLLPESEAMTVAQKSSLDLREEGGFLCPSKIAYAKIKKAKSFSQPGVWKWIVNLQHYTQTLRLEKCISPGSSCSYVIPFYRTSCTQLYTYSRLLAFDAIRGLHIDVFKIPTCCTCHVQGFYMSGRNRLQNNMLRRRSGNVGFHRAKKQAFNAPWPPTRNRKRNAAFERRRRFPPVSYRHPFQPRPMRRSFSFLPTPMRPHNKRIIKNVTKKKKLSRKINFKQLLEKYNKIIKLKKEQAKNVELMKKRKRNVRLLRNVRRQVAKTEKGSLARLRLLRQLYHRLGSI